MKFDNVYFINGTAYAGKSTIVKLLAQKYNGIACEENYHDSRSASLDKEKFPALTYTRNLKDFRHFIRRTPQEYENWIKEVNKECSIIELEILEDLVRENKDKKIFVDTNISLSTLREISDNDHVLIMLADPSVSINRFFDRPDKEKQFLYKIMLEEENPKQALENFRKCLERVNNKEIYDEFLNFGFNVVLRDDNRSIEETLKIVEEKLKLKE